MELVTFEIAKKLNEKGFAKNTMESYNDQGELMVILPDVWESVNTIPAPTIAEVLKWLRENKKINIPISLSMCGYRYDIQNNTRKTNEYADIYLWDNVYLNGEARFYKSYEEAALAGIEYVLDNLI